MIGASPDPALIGAAGWVQALLTGSVATGVAVIVVAATGLAMFAGRVDWRRGVRVVAGCFILFGAPVIANGLLGIVDAHQPPERVEEPAAIRVPVGVATPAAPPPGYDPYAGAAVPVR